MAASPDTAYERVARLLAASSDGAGDDDMSDADADALVSTTLWASLAVFFCLYALLLWLVPDKRDKPFKSRLIMYKHNSVRNARRDTHQRPARCTPTAGLTRRPSLPPFPLSSLRS